MTSVYYNTRFFEVEKREGIRKREILRFGQVLGGFYEEGPCKGNFMVGNEDNPLSLLDIGKVIDICKILEE